MLYIDAEKIESSNKYPNVLNSSILDYIPHSLPLPYANSAFYAISNHFVDFCEFVILYYMWVMNMEQTLYRFSSLKTNSNYLYQYVHGRKLTNIYHTHDFFEVIVVLNGQCTQLVNSNEHQLFPGEITILKPGDSHCFLSQSDDLRLVSLSVDVNEASLFHHAFNLNETINCSNKPIMFRARGEEIKLSQLFPKYATEISEHRLKRIYSSILCFYAESFNSHKEIPVSLQDAVQQLGKQKYLQEGIPAFVRLSGYSRSHLTRLVNKYYGITLQELISNLRLDAAKADILLTGEPLEDIAMKYGYSSFSHFCKIYKLKYGLTPAASRKKSVLWTI